MIIVSLWTILPEGNNPLLQRMNDYYSDAVFASTDRNGLIGEAVRIRDRLCGDTRIRAFLDSLIQLAQIARSEQKSLIVIAD